MSNREGTYDQIGRSPLAFLEDWVHRITQGIQHWFSDQHRVTRRVMVSAILVLALLAFELFNFDTTEYALEDLLGPTGFAGVRWATILAIAFCSIDFAGLARLIMPEERMQANGRMLKPAWLLLGAWLLGGGMNAVMTWWAVSLSLMGHSLGNEVLSRDQLLRIVPIFVAVLVWMTRILIISSFTANSEGIATPPERAVPPSPSRQQAVRPAPAPRTPKKRSPRPAPKPVATKAPHAVQDDSEPVYVGLDEVETPARPNGKVTPPRTVPRPPKRRRPPHGARANPTPLRLRSQNKGRHQL
jgi:hypothetical protein